MILITGATGRIGHQLADELIKRGENIRVLVRNKQKIMDKAPILPENMDIVQADITDKDSLKDIMKDVDTVFHLAAVVDYNAPKDMMHKVKGYMDRLIGEIPGAESSPWQFGKGQIPKGMSQEAIAAGLGIEVKAAHMGKDDVRVLEEISKHSKDYKTFKKRFLSNNGLANWAKFVDKENASSNMTYTKYSDVFIGKAGGSPSQATAQRIAESNAESAYTVEGKDLKKLDWSEAAAGRDGG